MLGSAQLDVDEVSAGIWTLRLDRPEVHNALSVTLRDEISTAVEVLGAQDDTRVMVLTGAGGTLCAGFDLAEFEPAAVDPILNARLWASSDRFHHTVLRCPVPIVCALNGPPLAGGFDLAVLCDLRVAQPGVWFARPEVAFGTPLFGPLRELVGGSRARELCYTNRRVELDEAVRVGLVNEVAPGGGALDAALQVAASIARRPPLAVRALRAKIVGATGLAAGPTLAL